MNTRTAIRDSLFTILSLCCSALPQKSLAQAGWTQEDCMQYAISHNLRIRNMELTSKIAHIDVTTAYGDFLPAIHAGGALSRQYGRPIDPRTNQYTSEDIGAGTMQLNVSLPIFEGFSRLHRLHFHKLNRSITYLLSRVEENNLAFEVLEAFYRHCFDREMHRLAIEQRRLGEYYCERMEEYVDLGMRSRADLQEVKARLQSDIYQETVRSNNCRLSLLTLKELMNMGDRDTLTIVMADGPVEVAACPVSLDELYAATESTLPEYSAMEAKEQAARRSLSVAKGALYPTIRMEYQLSTGYYDTQKAEIGNIVPFREQLSNNMNNYIGVSLSLPLFSGLARMGTLRRERIRLQQVRNEHAQQRLSLRKEVQETYLSFQATIEECRLAEEQLRAAAMTWSESEEKWKEGMVSMFELLEQRNRYIRAKAERVRTRLQYHLKRRLIGFYQKGTFF